MKKLAIGLAFVLSTLLCGQLWAQETATQLFLAPSAVPLQVYTNYLTTTTGGSVTFSASQVGGTIIKNVAVLPNLNPGPGLDCSYTQSQLDAINVDNYQSYFAYTPTVDYSATSPGGADSTVTFNQPGLFFVQLTTDAGVSAPIEVAVDTDLLGQLGVTPTGPNRWIWSLFSPANRSSVVSGTLNTPQDGNLLGWVLGSLGGSDNIQLVAGGGTAAEDEASLIGGIQAAEGWAGGGFPATLYGHGNAGSFQMGNFTLDDTNAAAFAQAVTNNVPSLRFISCNSASDLGFLQTIANTLGSATGFNSFVFATGGFGYFGVGATGVYETVEASVDVLTPLTPTDVSSQIGVSSTGFLYSRTSKQYTGNLTITNNGPPLSNPNEIIVVLNGLPQGVTLVNATGSYNSAPSIYASMFFGLDAGASITIPLQFTNPSNARITFTTQTLQQQFR